MVRKIGETIELINRDLQDLVGKKFEANDFHYEVEKVVKRHGSKYSLWTIRIDYRDIANLEVERKNDKRTKYNPQWTTLAIKFNMIDENILDMTVSEAIEYFEKKRLKGYIDGIDSSIEEMYAKIKEMKAQRVQLVEELDSKGGWDYEVYA